MLASCYATRQYAANVYCQGTQCSEQQFLHLVSQNLNRKKSFLPFFPNTEDGCLESEFYPKLWKCQEPDRAKSESKALSGDSLAKNQKATAT